MHLIAVTCRFCVFAKLFHLTIRNIPRKQYHKHVLNYMSLHFAFPLILNLKGYLCVTYTLYKLDWNCKFREKVGSFSFSYCEFAKSWKSFQYLICYGSLRVEYLRKILVRLRETKRKNISLLRLSLRLQIAIYRFLN